MNDPKTYRSIGQLVQENMTTYACSYHSFVLSHYYVANYTKVSFFIHMGIWAYGLINLLLNGNSWRCN